MGSKSTEAQKRASMKYTAKNVQHFNMALNKATDSDILQRLAEQSNKQGYIKALIRADIDKGQD